VVAEARVLEMAVRATVRVVRPQAPSAVRVADLALSSLTGQSLSSQEVVAAVVATHLVAGSPAQVVPRSKMVLQVRLAACPSTPAVAVRPESEAPLPVAALAATVSTVLVARAQPEPVACMLRVAPEAPVTAAVAPVLRRCARTPVVVARVVAIRPLWPLLPLPTTQVPLSPRA